MGSIGTEEYLVTLIDRYQNLIFSICYKMTNDYFASEDLTQDTFLSAFQHPESFKEGNEKAWICRIASNKCIDYLKAGGRRMIPTLEEDMQEQQSSIGLPEKTCMEEEVKTRLEQACNNLKPPYDEIAYLHFVEEKKPEEIALQKKIGIKTIQTQIYRARAMLRNIYEKEIGA